MRKQSSLHELTEHFFFFQNNTSVVSTRVTQAHRRSACIRHQDTRPCFFLALPHWRPRHPRPEASAMTHGIHASFTLSASDGHDSLQNISSVGIETLSKRKNNNILLPIELGNDIDRFTRTRQGRAGRTWSFTSVHVIVTTLCQAA